jgi:peroxiredoxin Q/BCP
MPKELAVGSPAPDFTLSDQQGAKWTLAHVLEQGPAFLVFYPGDLTPGCTVQLCTLRDDWSAFQKKQIGVFGVNPGGQKGHKLFATLYKLPFPLLVDEDKQLTKTFGLITKKLGFEFVKRTVVGIDKSGIIRYIKEGMPKPAELLKEAAKWPSS